MRHLQRIQLTDIVFLDIETARVVERLEKDTPLYDSWEYHQRYKNDTRTLELSYEQDAALYAEFARIICITVGTVRYGKIRLTSFSDKNEKTLLRRFTNLLQLCFYISTQIPFLLQPFNNIIRYGFGRRIIYFNICNILMSSYT